MRVCVLYMQQKEENQNQKSRCFRETFDGASCAECFSFGFVELDERDAQD